MPWLTIHLVVPLALLSGRFLGQLVARVQWGFALRSGGIVLLLAAPLSLLALWSLLTSGDQGPLTLRLWRVIGAWSYLAVLLLAGLLLWRRLGHQQTLPLIALSLAGVMLLFTLRAGVQAAYVHRNGPEEMLVYAQVSREVPLAVEEIERVARESRQGKAIPIMVDTSYASLAPWRWYLRNYEKVAYWDMTTYEGSIDAPVVILSGENARKIQPVKEQYAEGQRIPFLLWFAPWSPWDYTHYTAGKFFQDIHKADNWRRMMDYFTYRELRSEAPNQYSVVYFAKEP